LVKKGKVVSQKRQQALLIEQNFGKDRSLRRKAGAVMIRVLHALWRGLVVFGLFITPAITLCDGFGDTAFAIIPVALAASVIVFVEYNTTAPVLLTFRDSPPFNRIFALFFVISITILTIVLNHEPDGATAGVLLIYLGKFMAWLLGLPSAMAYEILAQTNVEPGKVLAASAWVFVIWAGSTTSFAAAVLRKTWPAETVNLSVYDPNYAPDLNKNRGKVLLMRALINGLLMVSMITLAPWMMRILISFADGGLAAIGVLAVLIVWGGFTLYFSMRCLAFWRLASLHMQIAPEWSQAFSIKQVKHFRFFT
jgi:hypothetical protein